jgi:hypothetical protein
MIKIFAFTGGRADLIELQMKSFKKYIQEDFTFTILNNTGFDHKDQRQPIEDECRKWGVEVFDVKRDTEIETRCNAVETLCTVFHTSVSGDVSYSNVNCAGCYGCCYTWEKHIVKEAGPICLLHPDVFFTHPVKLTDYLQKSPLWFSAQSRPNLGGIYPHDVLVLADIGKLPEPEKIFWWGGRVNGISTDIGGQSFFYLKQHPEVSPMFVQEWHRGDDPDVDFHPADYEILAIENKIVALHYFRASNWNHQSAEYHEKKTAWIKSKLNLDS